MLVIRLQRTGRSNLATYRIVLAEKSRAAKGKFQEILGHYLPTQKVPVIKVDTERAAHWIKLGAVPSNTVARLMKKEGAKGMEGFIKSYTKRVSKNAPVVEAPKPVAAAPVEASPVAVETPAVESAPDVPVEAPAVAETPVVETSPEVKLEEVPPAAEAASDNA